MNWQNVAYRPKRVFVTPPATFPFRDYVIVTGPTIHCVQLRTTDRRKIGRYIRQARRRTRRERGTNP